MLTYIRVIDGSLDDESIIKLLNSLEDGNYLVSIRKIDNLKTSKEHREHYFLLVDTCVNHTGYNRYEIHEMFKQHEEIASTKDFDPCDWVKFIESFKKYAFEKMDCVI